MRRDPQSDCTAKEAHMYHCLNEISSNCRQTADWGRLLTGEGQLGEKGENVISIKHTTSSSRVT